MTSALKNRNIVYNAFGSDVTFYVSKSYSKQPLKNTFEIESYLDDCNLKIDMFKKANPTENGVINIQSFPRIQFTGELLEFDYSELCENESTLVLKGDIKVLGKKKTNTFLGSIKRIEDVIYLKANVSLNPSDFEFEKVLDDTTSFKTAKSINIGIYLQLKSI
jgi:hypothetical protein